MLGSNDRNLMFGRYLSISQKNKIIIIIIIVDLVDSFIFWFVSPPFSPPTEPPKQFPKTTSFRCIAHHPLLKRRRCRVHRAPLQTTSSECPLHRLARCVWVVLFKFKNILECFFNPRKGFVKILKLGNLFPKVFINFGYFRFHINININ